MNPPQAFIFPARDGVGLTGTLELPEGDGPFPAALLLVGSGEVDRDSDHPKMALGVTRDIARALANAGIASLRYDKRGVGASGGNYLTTTFEDVRDDAAAALTALRAHPSVDGGRTLVVGHSEGAIHATSLAATDPTLAGVGLLAGTASTGEVTLLWQAEAIVPTLPVVVRGLMKALRQSPERSQGKLLAKIRSSDEAVMRIQLQRINAGWMRGFVDHDPAIDLARVTVPVFALTGDRDLQVDADDLERIAALVTGAPVETHRLPELNHLLRHTTGSGSPTGYKRQLKTGRPIDRRVLDALIGWAGAQLAVAV